VREAEAGRTLRVIRSTFILALAALVAAPGFAATKAAEKKPLRPEVREFIEITARDLPIDAKQLEKLLAQAVTKQSILDAISRPAERVTPWYEYRERFMTEKRIQQGVDFWSANTEYLAAIADDGIAAAVAGICGVETSFGRITGRFRVVDALYTLAFDFPAREAFFRSELQQFVLLAKEQKIDPKKAQGSYAGAMGMPQFMPSSYRKFAADGNADGHIDLWSSTADVIASVANYLRVHGWRSGEPVVADATLQDPDLSRFDSASTIALNETVGSLRDKGVIFETTLAPDAPAMLIILTGKDGPEYRVGFTNFFVITRYNRSTLYANAVNDLGRGILGAVHAPQPVAPQESR
jgi:membrane-bound lytic murein transglycosylase B